MEARARLLRHLLALGVDLVLEHVGVAALLAEVLAERVAGPDRLQPRILVQPRLRHHRPRIDGGRRPRHRFAAAEARPHLIDGPAIAVVLRGEVAAPHRRVDRLVVQLDDAEERVPRFLLVLEDRDEDADDGDCGDSRERMLTMSRRRPVIGDAPRTRGSARRRSPAPGGPGGGVAGGGNRPAHRRGDRARDLGVTLQARRFGDGAVAWSHLDGIREAAEGEVVGMKEAVGRLGRVLAGHAGRRMAVVADGHAAVAAARPPGELLRHDVAVGAGRRIVGHVGIAAGVDEREAAQADAGADRRRRGPCEPRPRVRRRFRRGLCHHPGTSASGVRLGRRGRSIMTGPMPMSHAPLVLCAVDFSPPSADIVRHAAACAGGPGPTATAGPP